MKKLLSVVCFALFAVVLSTAAFADIAPSPVREPTGNAIVPIVIAVVIIAVVVLIKVLKSKKK